MNAVGLPRVVQPGSGPAEAAATAAERPTEQRDRRFPPATMIDGDARICRRRRRKGLEKCVGVCGRDLGTNFDLNKLRQMDRRGYFWHRERESWSRGCFTNRSSLLNVWDSSSSFFFFLQFVCIGFEK